MPRAIPALRAVARMPEAIPRYGRGTLPITALLLGDWKIPEPKPKKARRHPTARAEADTGKKAIATRAAVQSEAPATASSLVPKRSDKLPLRGRSHDPAGNSHQQ